MKRASEIYQRSLALMGEVENEENEVLKERAVMLINVLLSQLYELDLGLRGVRFSPGETVPQIRTLQDEVGLSEPILYTVMPLGLAGYLLNEEEPARSKYFLQLFTAQCDLYRARFKKSFRHKIRRSF